jgi:hypothetical protein
MNLCPHKFGWDYNTSRDRRWCLLCAQGQRLLIVLNTGTAIWIRAESADEIERPHSPSRAAAARVLPLPSGSARLRRSS